MPIFNETTKKFALTETELGALTEKLVEHHPVVLEQINEWFVSNATPIPNRDIAYQLYALNRTYIVFYRLLILFTDLNKSRETANATIATTDGKSISMAELRHILSNPKALLTNIFNNPAMERDYKQACEGDPTPPACHYDLAAAPIDRTLVSIQKAMHNATLSTLAEIEQKLQKTQDPGGIIKAALELTAYCGHFHDENWNLKQLDLCCALIPGSVFDTYLSERASLPHGLDNIDVLIEGGYINERMLAPVHSDVVGTLGRIIMKPDDLGFQYLVCLLLRNRISTLVFNQFSYRFEGPGPNILAQLIGTFTVEKLNKFLCLVKRIKPDLIADCSYNLIPQYIQKVVITASELKYEWPDSDPDPYYGSVANTIKKQCDEPEGEWAAAALPPAIYDLMLNAFYVKKYGSWFPRFEEAFTKTDISIGLTEQDYLEIDKILDNQDTKSANQETVAAITGRKRPREEPELTNESKKLPRIEEDIVYVIRGGLLEGLFTILLAMKAEESKAVMPLPRTAAAAPASPTTVAAAPRAVATVGTTVAAAPSAVATIRATVAAAPRAVATVRTTVTVDQVVLLTSLSATPARPAVATAAAVTTAAPINWRQPADSGVLLAAAGVFQGPEEKPSVKAILPSQLPQHHLTQP